MKQRPIFQVRTDIYDPAQYDEEHNWGYEIVLVNNPHYCLKKFVLFGRPEGKPADRLHYHEKKTETFIVDCGAVLITIEKEQKILRQGEQCTIYPGTKHTFFAITKIALMLEVSTYHADSDTHRED